VIGPIYAVERNTIESYDTERILKVSFFLVMALFIFTYGINCVMTQKNILVDSILRSQEQKSNVELILDNLEESIMITKDDKIEFVNDKFLEMFVSQINQFKDEHLQKKKEDDSLNIDSPVSDRNIMYRLKSFLLKCFKKSQSEKKEEEGS
jgi:hypothetical protein